MDVPTAVDDVVLSFGLLACAGSLG